jgi:hypothetical protein
MIQNPDDIEIRKAAAIIAVRCRRVVMSVLRDEELAEADREFSEIAEAVIRELAAFKAGRKQ